MALTFPNSPTTGQIYTAENGIQYRYDGTKWTTIGSDNATAGIYTGDNVSLLTNDAGYITAAQVPAPTPTDTLNAIKTVDGTGSGLDADLLDGQEGTYYLDYNNATNKPSLATVATSGNYSDLSGRPSLANVATSGSYNDLSNKPTIGNGTIQINQGGSSKGSFSVNQSGGTTINLDGGSGTTGPAVKHVIFDNDGSIIKQSGVASVTKVASGRYTVNFAGNMPSANYLVLSTGRNYDDDNNERSLSIYGTPTTATCTVHLVANNNGGPGGCGGHIAFYNV